MRWTTALASWPTLAVCGADDAYAATGNPPGSVASSGGTNGSGSVEAHWAWLAGLVTLEAAADPPVREEW
jgi:hypothetical protein